MRVIDIADCKEGDIVAQKICNRSGIAVIVEDTVLNGYIINRLTELGVQQVAIYNDCMETKLRNAKKSYDESISGIKYMISELAAGKTLDIDNINSILDIIYCGTHESCYILRILNEEKSFDEYTYTHSLNVAYYAMLIGKWLKFDNDDIKDLIKAGLLHDIGKINIPIDILNKEAILSGDEFDFLKKHTIFGYDLAKSIRCLSDEVCKAILLHHEREDRSGYPFGFGGDQINTCAKIIAIADVYDAMTSNRVYKKGATPFEVFEMFNTIGVESFEPKITKTFLTNISTCYVGSKVLINTGEIGEVVYIPPHNITEPVINIGHGYIDLAQKRDKNILSIV